MKRLRPIIIFLSVFWALDSVVSAEETSNFSLVDPELLKLSEIGAGRRRENKQEAITDVDQNVLPLSKPNGDGDLDHLYTSTIVYQGLVLSSPSIHPSPRYVKAGVNMNRREI